MSTNADPLSELVDRVGRLGAPTRSQLAHSIKFGAVDLGDAAGLRDQLNIPTFDAKALSGSFHRSAAIVTPEVARGAVLGACLGKSDPVPPQLVWTAPGAPAAARRTAEVVLDLVRSARSTLVVVGYSLTKAASPLIADLAAATRRGVSCSIVVDRMEEKLETLFELWPKDLGMPPLWSRPRDADDEMSALHAKAVIVDRRRLLITSANLTYHGFHGNIELGVLIEGLVAAAAEDLIREWSKAGLIRRVGVPPS